MEPCFGRGWDEDGDGDYSGLSFYSFRSPESIRMITSHGCQSFTWTLGTPGPSENCIQSMYSVYLLSTMDMMI